MFLLDILCNTEYLIHWVCWKIAKRAACACVRKLGNWPIVSVKKVKVMVHPY